MKRLLESAARLHGFLLVLASILMMIYCFRFWIVFSSQFSTTLIALIDNLFLICSAYAIVMLAMIIRIWITDQILPLKSLLGISIRCIVLFAYTVFIHVVERLVEGPVVIGL